MPEATLSVPGEFQFTEAENTLHLVLRPQRFIRILGLAPDRPTASRIRLESGP